MRRFFLMWLLIIITLHTAKAQTSTATGTVKNDKGDPLHFVFVVDEQYKEAAYSDSTGNFTITIHPDSRLKFELAGYKDTLVRVGKNQDLPVVLRSLGADYPGNSLNTRSTVSGGTDIQHADDVDLLRLPGHEKGKVRGNRYLFDNFAHGFIISSTDALLHDPAYTFDYDKMGGALLLTKDKTSVEEVSFDHTKSFTLYDDKDKRFVFEKVIAIDPSHYVQVLASGKRYKIYKLIKTRFAKSDYVNTGVTSHGNDYDEYIDDPDYYVLDLQGGQPQKLSLKKKSIKEDFAKEADKVNKFLSDNPGNIDDAYLSKLGNYMNQ
jgi:hypothetical protein